MDIRNDEKLSNELEGNSEVLFLDVMSEGIKLSVKKINLDNMKKAYPEYLKVDRIVKLSIEDKLDPTKLCPNTAYGYKDNLYVTDAKGNIAYIDCQINHVEGVREIKKQHTEYRLTGGKRALNKDMDAGHFGVQLDQHPSITMEQHFQMNRYGSWRTMERDWDTLARVGHSVNIKGVFVDDGNEGTFSPYWCIQESIDNEETASYVFLNDENQF